MLKLCSGRFRNLRKTRALLPQIFPCSHLLQQIPHLLITLVCSPFDLWQVLLKPIRSVGCLLRLSSLFRTFHTCALTSLPMPLVGLITNPASLPVRRPPLISTALNSLPLPVPTTSYHAFSNCSAKSSYMCTGRPGPTRRLAWIRLESFLLPAMYVLSFEESRN